MEEFKKVASLSERIKQAMGLSGMKQIELSKATGINDGKPHKVGFRHGV